MEEAQQGCNCSGFMENQKNSTFNKLIALFGLGVTMYIRTRTTMSVVDSMAASVTR